MTEGLRGKVGTELGANHSVVAVGAGDLSPDDADLGATDLLLSGVDVSDTLGSVAEGRHGSVQRVLEVEAEYSSNSRFLHNSL